MYDVHFCENNEQSEQRSNLFLEKRFIYVPKGFKYVIVIQGLF